MQELLKCECPPGSKNYEDDEGMQICFSCGRWIDLVLMMSSNVLLEKKIEPYTNCSQCHIHMSHCHCKCPYCGQRDDCECALFDTVTGG